MIHPRHALSYVLFVGREIVAGTIRIAAAGLSPAERVTPSIVELPLRCRTDLEVAALASSITITPGTLVVGAAPATGAAPPTLYVHSMFGSGRDEVTAGLRDLEDRLLRATRGSRWAPSRQAPR